MDIDPHFLAQAKIALASFFGGMVRLFLRPASSFLKSLALVACCVVCGYYFTPPAMMVSGLDENWAGAIGALIGLVGLSIADALVNINYKAAFEKALHNVVDSWTAWRKAKKD